jgi:voltage-gated potassium channel Kch
VEELRAAHTDRAQLFVVAIADPVESLRVARTVRRHYPQLKVIACARTRHHALELMDLGVHSIVRRSYFSSLEATRQVLTALGHSAEDAQAATETFARHDHDTLLKQHAGSRDEDAFRQSARQSARELEQLFESDTKQPRS